MAAILARLVYCSGEIFNDFEDDFLQLLPGDLKMASFSSDMEESHRIVMETPDISDVS